jgi:hypothetical protein
MIYKMKINFYCNKVYKIKACVYKPKIVLWKISIK